MIIDIRLPKFRLPRKWSRATKDWQRWLVVFPFYGFVEGSNRRRLILPGWHETRISRGSYRRVWREIGEAK